MRIRLRKFRTSNRQPCSPADKQNSHTTVVRNILTDLAKGVTEFQPAVSKEEILVAIKDRNRNKVVKPSGKPFLVTEDQEFYEEVTVHSQENFFFLGQSGTRSTNGIGKLR